MPNVSLRIPQIGEGLQEARLVAVLKQPGDPVSRDEVVYQMETDKAILDVESPASGVLQEWLAQVGDVLPIGAEVGLLLVAEGGVAPSPAQPSEPDETRRPDHLAATEFKSRRKDLPPKSRAYARSQGLTEEDLELLPDLGRKLMPEDVDRFASSRASAASRAQKRVAPFSGGPMSPQQRLLASRLQRGANVAVPGTMSVVADWGPIERSRDLVKASADPFKPSAFTMFAFCVAQAAARNPLFRSTLVADGLVRTYEHLHLGIAVGLPEDELVLAVVEDADALGWREFAERMRDRIELARGGKDQASESVTLSLTNMQAHGIREAVPVVVPPAVATLFLGEPHFAFVEGESRTPMLQRCVSLGITFDHRLINGVGAAEFLNEVRKQMKEAETWATK